MFRDQTLRALVNERLAAAAEDIFVLFERAIVEYEEELCRSKENNNFSSTTEEVRGNFRIPWSSPGPALNQEITETPQIKDDPEEQSIKQEEEQLPVSIPEFSAVCVKTEESSLLQQIQTEHREEMQGEDISSEPRFHSETEGHSSDTDNDDDWEPFNYSAAQMETEADGDHYNQVQTRDRSTKLSLKNKSAPETTVHSENMSGAHGGAADRKKHQCSACNKRFQSKGPRSHKEVTPEELDNLEDDNDKDEDNTKKMTKWAVKTLRDFLAHKNMDINFENYSTAALNDSLRLFYASVQSTKEGKEYSFASLRSLRTGINRHLTDVNIIADTAFKSSNAVLRAILKRYRNSGKDASSRHPRIPESDLHTLRCSPALSPDTPLGLVRKVWFDIQLCLGRRGREGNRELTMASFSVQRDEDGVEYVSLSHNPVSKNPKVPNDLHKPNLKGFMFERPGDPLCPVKSFKKYVSKCPPDAKSFYLHPMRSITVASNVWYSKEPMGTNYLGEMLKKISEEVGLSQIYTNHSLRSTAVGRLFDAGLEARQIMSVTGQRCERNLQSRWAPSVQERREWSNILSSRNAPSSSGHCPSNAAASVSTFASYDNDAFNFK